MARSVRCGQTERETEYNVVLLLQHCSLPSGLAFCPVVVTSSSEARLSTSFVLGSASAVGLFVFVAVGPN